MDAYERFLQEYGLLCVAICAVLGGCVAVFAHVDVADKVYVGTILAAFIGGAIGGGLLGALMVFVVPPLLVIVAAIAAVGGALALLLWIVGLILSIRVA
ncbi:MAG: hypothetical protein AAGM38_07950 [Pseudomonadota bacterium]